MRINNHRGQTIRSLQPTDKENDSDKKDNSINPQQKEMTSGDDTISRSDATILIQKSESSKTKADEAVADKAESNTSFQPVDIQKKLLHQKVLDCILQIRCKHPYKYLVTYLAPRRKYSHKMRIV